MRALRAWTTSLNLLAATASASAAVNVTTIGAQARTSLVLLWDSDVGPATIVQSDPRTVVLGGSNADPCQPVHARSGDAATLVVSVTLECSTPHDFTATVITRADVRASIRLAGRRLYLDLTPRRATGAAPAAQASSASADIYARARELADAGKVRDLAALLSHVTPAQRRDAILMGRLEALVDVARQRRLELDRELFTNDGRGGAR